MRFPLLNDGVMQREQAGPSHETSLPEDPVDALQHIRGRLSSIYHDANNPLSIISGNAQYMLELIRAMGVADDLEQPALDIEEACRRIGDELKELRKLKEEVVVFLAGRQHGG